MEKKKQKNGGSEVPFHLPVHADEEIFGSVKFIEL